MIVLMIRSWMWSSGIIAWWMNLRHSRPDPLMNIHPWQLHHSQSAPLPNLACKAIQGDCSVACWIHVESIGSRLVIGWVSCDRWTPPGTSDLRWPALRDHQVSGRFSVSLLTYRCVLTHEGSLANVYASVSVSRDIFCCSGSTWCMDWLFEMESIRNNQKPSISSDHLPAFVR